MKEILALLLVAIFLVGAVAPFFYLSARKMTEWGKDKKRALRATGIWFICGVAGSMIGAVISKAMGG